MFKYYFECDKKHQFKLDLVKTAFLREVTPNDDKYLNPIVIDMHLEDGTHGTFSDAKMNTLVHYLLPATGFICPSDFCEMVRKHNVTAKIWDDESKIPQSAEFQKIACYANVADLSKAEHSWLRDNLRLSLYPGAFRIIISAANGFIGEVRVAFSGLSQEQDLDMAMKLFNGFQRALASVGGGCAQYNLTTLKQYHPTLAYYLIANDVRSVVA